MMLVYPLHHTLVNPSQTAEPPCMSDADDWESAGGWTPDYDLLAESTALVTPQPPVDISQGPAKLPGQISVLRKAWESSARVTKDDWAEWMRHFSVELLAQSPSPALRACHSLAQVGMGCAVLTCVHCDSVCNQHVTAMRRHQLQ